MGRSKTNTSMTKSTGSPTRLSRGKFANYNDNRTVTELVRDISGITFNDGADPASPKKVVAVARNKNSV